MKFTAEDYRILRAAMWAALNDDHDPWLSLPADLIDRAEEILESLDELVGDEDDDESDE